jgi:hypothetical protein
MGCRTVLPLWRTGRSESPGGACRNAKVPSPPERQTETGANRSAPRTSAPASRGTVLTTLNQLLVAAGNAPYPTGLKMEESDKLTLVSPDQLWDPPSSLSIHNSRMHGPIPPLPPYIIAAWPSKLRDDLMSDFKFSQSSLQRPGSSLVRREPSV